MSSHSAEEINKHVRVYIGVFVSLMVLTLVTVGVSYLHLSPAMAIVVALIVAGIKGTLVAGIFMHLFDEFKENKPVLFWTLVLTVTFFFVVLLLPLFNYLNRLGQ